MLDFKLCSGEKAKTGFIIDVDLSGNSLFIDIQNCELRKRCRLNISTIFFLSSLMFWLKSVGHEPAYKILEERLS